MWPRRRSARSRRVRPGRARGSPCAGTRSARSRRSAGNSTLLRWRIASRWPKRMRSAWTKLIPSGTRRRTPHRQRGVRQAVGGRPGRCSRPARTSLARRRGTARPGTGSGAAGAELELPAAVHADAVGLAVVVGGEQLAQRAEPRRLDVDHARLERQRSMSATEWMIASQLTRSWWDSSSAVISGVVCGSRSMRRAWPAARARRAPDRPHARTTTVPWYWPLKSTLSTAPVAATAATSSSSQSGVGSSLNCSEGYLSRRRPQRLDRRRDVGAAQPHGDDEAHGPRARGRAPRAAACRPGAGRGRARRTRTSRSGSAARPRAAAAGGRGRGARRGRRSRPASSRPPAGGPARPPGMSWSSVS